MKKVLIGFITGILNGFFGSGGGTILVPSLERFLNIEEQKAHATAIAVILPLSIVSTFLYFSNIKGQWLMLFCVSVGGIIGGVAGSKLLAKISPKWLHIIFGIFMLIGGVKLALW